MTTAVLPQRSARPSRKARHDTIVFYLCVAPWVIGFIAFTLGPMLYSLYISFTEWGMLKPPVWLGATNYTRAIADPDFYTALKVTSFFAVFSIPVALITALFLAIL